MRRYIVEIDYDLPDDVDTHVRQGIGLQAAIVRALDARADVTSVRVSVAVPAGKGLGPRWQASSFGTYSTAVLR